MIVVSGGTKGIGKRIVLLFLQKGFEVITCSRSANNIKDLTDQAGSLQKQLHTTTADLSNKDDIKRFADFILSKTKKINALINNTGVFVPGEVLTEPEGTLEQLFNTNVVSAYYLTRALSGSFDQTHIFNICSTASIMAFTNGGSYCITKFALLGFNKVLREELKTKNCKVTAVLPGPTLTSSWDGIDLPPERFIDAGEVAMQVYDAFKLSPRTVIEEILIRPQLGDL